MREHGHASLAIPWPFFPGPIPVQLHAISIGIAQINCFAYAMIAGPLKRDAGRQDAAQCAASSAPRWVDNCKMIKPGRSHRRSAAAGAFPGIEPDMMVISARR